MPNPSSKQIEIRQVREIASRKLQQYGKSDSAIRASYLFDKDFLTGVRYEAGSFCFLWKSAESSAVILRGDLLIETVNLNQDREERFDERRAA